MWTFWSPDTDFHRFSQILAMRNLKIFFCGWCWDKIRNNVWETHRGNSFPQRNFSELISGRSLFDWKSSIFSRFEHKFAYILSLGCAFFFQNQSWRLSSWKTWNKVFGTHRGDNSAQRIFSDSTSGRSLLQSTAAPLGGGGFAEFFSNLLGQYSTSLLKKLSFWGKQGK